jgi:hypothetical protein
MAGAAIDEVRHGVQRFSLKHQRSCTMNQQSTNAVVNGAQNVLVLPVLLIRVWAGEAKGSALRSKESPCGVVIIFSAIVGLKGDDRELKLSANVREKGTNYGSNIRLLSDRISPDVMCKSINEHHIIFVPRVTVNRRGPNIGVDELKKEKCSG